jgi:signal transduction histidine kinase
MREILTSLCRLVESIASGCSCSVVLLDPNGTELQEAIAPSLAAEFNDAVRGWPLHRVGGPCVMAARDNTQVIMADVASDTRWRNGWRSLAQKHGLRSCWSTPIVSLSGRVLGTFALYQREPGSPNPPQLELIEQFTHIASIAIEGAQRDAALDKVRSELAHVTRAMSLGALTASIAHEVNQPLAAIVTNASACLHMLAADPPNLEGARQTARRTIRDGNRAGDVIARLRALFGKEAAAAESLDLNEATREVLSLVSNDLWRNRVVLRVELDDDPLLVIGDRVQLQQVILNLVRNASDAMRDVNDRPRHLLVRAEREDGRGARFIVKDSGVGLDPQTAERLFEAFYTTKSDGMGIGLSVSRSIIENHGGKLSAAANDDQGATFSFSIPELADRSTGERARTPLER